MDTSDYLNKLIYRMSNVRIHVRRFKTTGSVRRVSICCRKQLKQQLAFSVTIQCRPAAEYGGPVVFYTSGERVILEDCNSTFVWRPDPSTTIPVTYSDWAPGQPDCYGGTESCIQIWPELDYGWNDNNCWSTGCPLCQIDMV